MLTALLVDMDGTLVHTANANAAAYAAALAEHGVAADADALAPLIDGRSWRDFLPDLVAGHPATRPEDVARRKREIYPRFFHLLRPNQPVIDLVRLLHGPLATALVTTASALATDAVLGHFGLHDLFDTLVTGDHVVQAKPAPEGYAMAAQLLGARPQECLVIEDSETGAAAASAFCGGLLRWSEPFPGAHARGANRPSLVRH